MKNKIYDIIKQLYAHKKIIMSISIDDFPTAEQATHDSEVRAKESEEKFRQRAEHYTQQTNTLCDMYKTYMLTCIKDSLNHWNGKERIRIRANLDHILTVENRSCKAHFIHYGNFSAKTSSWKSRHPFVIGRNPFQELQTELFQKKGWILVDETDPDKSFMTYICLYNKKPTNYDETRPLWHGLNKLPENLLPKTPVTTQ